MENYELGNYKEVFADYPLIEKIDKLNISAEEVIRHTPIKSIQLSDEAFNLSKRIQYKKGAAKSLFIKGKASYIFGNSEEANSFLMDALQITKEDNLKEYEADILNVLGNVNIDLSNYNSALEYYIKSLEIIHQFNYKNSECKVLNNVGEIYKDLKNYQEALKYYLQSLEICNLISAENVKCIVLQNIGEVYYYLNDYQTAKDFTERSMQLSRTVKDRMIEAACLHQLGKINLKQDNSIESLNLFLKSLEISKETNERFFMITVMIDLHDLLIKNNNFDEAVEYLGKALSLAYEINSKEMISKINSYLAEIHEKIGQYDKALYYYKKFHDHEKKVMDESVEHKLKNITLQFKMEQSLQEKEIYRLKNVELKEKTEALEKKTSELLEFYNNMKTISQIGQDITSTLNFEKILQLVYISINNLMPAYTFGIALYDKETGTIEYSLFIENSKRYPVFSNSIANKSGWASWCIINRKEILINDVENEYKLYMEDRKITPGAKMQSLMYCPLIFENNVLGVITVQSITKNAYSQYNLDTLKALASYIAIAIRNAQKSNDLEKLNERLLVLSNLDGLTEIPNRRYFDEQAEIDWNIAKINSEPYTIILIDVDSFKEYNDNYGHLAGDYCLKQIAKALQAASNEFNGFSARYGGDEFATVFKNISTEAALNIAEKIKNLIDELNIEHKYSKAASHVTLTIGLCTMIPNEELTVKHITAFADKALYAAKQKGRNRIGVY
ncbi:diguanylate cyclase domain-containing protein [Candidatus Clostridium stratigraminis]|uniref:Diguanylate cyclase domain-containing protein n=1 Tax=Candidatus Clostridium stratigraminis TaxID=3381661 RepID=A0ABW8T6Y2_9CLOT